MSKELICLGNADGFIDLQLLNEKRTGSTTNAYGKTIRGGDSDNYRKRMALLQINEASLVREYANLLYDSKIAKLQEELRVRRGEYISQYKKKYDKLPSIKLQGRIVAEINSKIRQLLQLKRKEVMNFDIRPILNGLLKRCPDRFHSITTEAYIMGKVKEKVGVVTIKTQAMPYWLQQMELGRETYDTEEMLLIRAMQETMRVKDDKMTFDGYLDDWKDRLLAWSENGGGV